MDQTFLSLIALIAAGYAFFTRQAKQGLGFLIYVAAFILLIPGLASGILNDVFRALAMILFVVGSFIIIWRKKEVVDKVKEEDDEKTK